MITRKRKITRRDKSEIRVEKTGRIITRRPLPETEDSKFTRSVRGIIYRGLLGKIPITRCLELSGITYSIFSGWMKKGQDPTNRAYRKFRQRILELRTMHEKNSLAIIEEAAKGGKKVNERKITIKGDGTMEVTRINKTLNPAWYAAAWYLERFDRKTYGREALDNNQGMTPDEFAIEIRKAMEVLDQSIPEPEGFHE